MHLIRTFVHSMYVCMYVCMHLCRYVQTEAVLTSLQEQRIEDVYNELA